MPDRPAQLSQDGLTVYCPCWTNIPGLLHGITTRAAMPQRGKDDFFNSLERARLAGAIPRVLTVGADQVHEAHVEAICEPLDTRHQVDGLRCREDLQACEFPATDALVTTLPGLLLVIQTADCLPVFMVDAENQVLGLAHCGWRGLRQGLASELARVMISSGAQTESLQVWLGPCISPERYEVGQDLVREFAAAFPGAQVSPNGTHLDLPAVARWQLRQAGLSDENVVGSGECTLGQIDRYHSYRGEAGAAGRMFSFIGLGPFD